MNILELIWSIENIYDKGWEDKHTTQDYFNHMMELLLCAEAQGWVSVQEPFDYAPDYVPYAESILKQLDSGGDFLTRVYKMKMEWDNKGGK